MSRRLPVMLMTTVMGLAGLVLSRGALAAPPAGTPIVNTASGTATLTSPAGPIAVQSNTVRAIVQAIAGLTLTPQRYAQVMPGTDVLLLTHAAQQRHFTERDPADREQRGG